ncbi:unnamed protein product [Rotaria sordida]|uniref:Uncharacterized protein n=1 Tax=Rotaria sordida TaxID=392033 RepID=A0A813YXU2_9BILA|nr:unnamed protein product [Rotaria sordida]CAF0891494.1 unnamed protein product [Rotaria sordida]
MLSLIQVMKTIATFFNNYRINRNVYNINTNTTIDRIECERNVCEKELHRLKYGLENLLKNKAHKNFQIRKTNWIDQCWSCCRRCTRNRNHIPYNGWKKYDLKRKIANFLTSKIATIDPTCKSILFKILEGKILDCLSNGQKVDQNRSDSISITSLSTSYESPSNSSILTDNEFRSPHIVLSQPSTTDTISTLKSSSISAFPYGTSTSNVDHTLTRLTSKNDISKANDYEKSTLSVPVAKTLRSSDILLDILIDYEKVKQQN